MPPIAHGQTWLFQPLPVSTVPNTGRNQSDSGYRGLNEEGRNLKTMNAKTMKKSRIHENADANITCDFGDGDISRSRSRLPHTRTDGHIVSSIIDRCTSRVCSAVKCIIKMVKSLCH